MESWEDIKEEGFARVENRLLFLFVKL